MNFLSRRTIRKYKDKDIEESKIKEILEAALVAPTGRNLKPFELIVVRDKTKLENLSISKKTGSHMLKSANLAIIVLGNPEISETWLEDCSSVTSHIQMKAHDLEIGSCWINVKNRVNEAGVDSEKYVKTIFSIPDNLRISSIISLGYPDEIKEDYKSSDLDFSKIHNESYKK